MKNNEKVEIVEQIKKMTLEIYDNTEDMAEMTRIFSILYECNELVKLIEREPAHTK